MHYIDSIVLEATAPDSARAFYDRAFALDRQIRVRAATAPSSGFRAASR